MRALLIGAVLIAAIAITAPGARSQTWNIQVVDNTSSVGYQSQIAVTSDGTPYITHVQSSNTNFYLTWWVPSGGGLGSWQKLTVSNANSSRPTEILADSADRLHMTWTNTGKDSVMYAVFDGPTKSWHQSPVGVARAQFAYADLAIFEDEGVVTPTIAFAPSGILNTATRDPVAGTWSFETVYGAGNVGQVSVAADSVGAIHIAFYETSGSDLMYATNAHGAWSVEYVDIGGSVGNYCSIVVEPGNVPYIAYYDQTNTDLKYARLIP